MNDLKQSEEPEGHSTGISPADRKKTQEDVAIQNAQSLKTLERAIAFSQGRFSLILVRCNYGHLRQRILEQLRRYSNQIQELVLSEAKLFSAIQAELGSKQPGALMVLGLESLTAVDDLLISTNRLRDEFPKSFSFPLVLWLNDEVLPKMVKLAPDFYSWAGVPIQFALATDELIELVQQALELLFSELLDAGAERFVDNASLNLHIGTGSFELESALKELQSRGCYQPELEASQQFIWGRDAYTKNQMERSRELYEQSLAFWQSSKGEPSRGEPSRPYLEGQACLLFHLGLWWRKYVVLHPEEYQTNYRRAQNYYQQCVEVLQKVNRPELAAKFINSLAEVLLQLGQWDELETIAKAAVVLHQNYPDFIQLADAYAFLAEAASAQGRWSQTQQYTETALRTIRSYATSSLNTRCR